MIKNPINGRLLLDARDHLQLAPGAPARLDVNRKHAFEAGNDQEGARKVKDFQLEEVCARNAGRFRTRLLKLTKEAERRARF